MKCHTLLFCTISVCVLCNHEAIHTSKFVCLFFGFCNHGDKKKKRIPWQNFFAPTCFNHPPSMVRIKGRSRDLQNQRAQRPTCI